MCVSGLGVGVEGIERLFGDIAQVGKVGAALGDNRLVVPFAGNGAEACFLPTILFSWLKCSAGKADIRLSTHLRP